MQISRDEVVLSGLDGGNPLGFLASLGAFRVLSQLMPDAGLRLRWVSDGTWKPAVSRLSDLQPSDISTRLHSALAKANSRAEFNVGDDLTIPPSTFREFACEAAKSAEPAGRTTADFVAAFGCDALHSATSEKPIIQDTALRTMAGAGHQHFLGFMRNIVEATTEDSLHKSLFEPWAYDDAVQNLTLRWDPLDDVRYALRWRDPSGDPLRRKRGNMLGANRLAIEGVPLLPTIPARGGLGTTGFRGRRSSDTFWTWPIWDSPATLDVVRSLLAIRTLQADNPDRVELRSRGVVEAFRSQRITIGKVRNFTAAESV